MQKTRGLFLQTSLRRYYQQNHPPTPRRTRFPRPNPTIALLVMCTSPTK